MLVSGSPDLSWGKVGRFGRTYMPSTGSFDIKHLYFEKCPSHFGLSGRILGSFWGLLCSQPKPSLATKSGKTGADCCCFGARCCPLCCSTGRLGSNPSGMRLRGSSGAHLPPHTALSVTLVLECLCGTKMHFSSWGKVCLFCQEVPMCPSSDCFFWLRP